MQIQERWPSFGYCPALGGGLNGRLGRQLPRDRSDGAGPAGRDQPGAEVELVMRNICTPPAGLSSSGRCGRSFSFDRASWFEVSQ